MKIRKFIIKSTTGSRSSIDIRKRQLFDFFTNKHFTITNWTPTSSGLKVELYGEKFSFDTLYSDFTLAFGAYFKIRRILF